MDITDKFNADYPLDDFIDFPERDHDVDGT